MKAQLLPLVNQYSIDDLMQALQNLKVREQGQEEEVFIEVWSGDSIVKNVTACLGKTNRNRYFLLTGSQTSSEESDAATLGNSIRTILQDLRRLNPPQQNGSHILAHDFLIPTGSQVKAWKVALGTTVGAHRWIRRVGHVRINTPIQ